MSILLDIEMIKDILVAVGASAGAASLLSALKDYLSKKLNKKITIANHSINLTGIKERDLEIILNTVNELRKHPQVFLAYPSEQKELAKNIAHDLKENGVKVWLDENELKPGDSISNKISNALKESQWVIYIPPENGSPNRWIEKEIKLAKESEKNRQRSFIIPIKTLAGTIPDFLKDRMWVDFSEDYQSGIQTLLGGIIRENNSESSLSNNEAGFLTKGST